MSPRGVLIIGSGKRVREDALPALQKLEESFTVRGVYARTPKEVRAGEREVAVRSLAELGAEDVAASDLLYLAVSKDAVPAVLAHLAAFDLSGVDLLIDTPVVRFKHFRHVERLSAFRDAWVAEDCSELPFFDTVREVVDSGEVGELRRALFDRSAYAYHGLAMARTLLRCDRIGKGRRKRTGPDRWVRCVQLSSGRSAEFHEPRDYSAGRLVLEGTRGSVSDRPGDPPGSLLLEPVLEDGRCSGFRIGDAVSRLSDDEAELMRGRDPDAGVIARMEDMKRVGFLRLLKRIRDGAGAYPLELALEDMVVDYHLEKLGFWLPSPFTSPRFGLGRFLLRTVTRLGG